MVHGIFPEARGVKTDRYTMEICIDRDNELKRVLIFDDWNDPYQLHNISWKEDPDRFASLWEVLEDKLEEADDIWFREGIMDNLSLNHGVHNK